jgi:hypothetical protein
LPGTGRQKSPHARTEFVVRTTADGYLGLDAVDSYRVTLEFRKQALLFGDDGKSGFVPAPWTADNGKSASRTLLPYGGFVLIFGG